MVRETMSFPEDGPVEPERADLSKVQMTCQRMSQVTFNTMGSEEAQFAKSQDSE